MRRIAVIALVSVAAMVAIHLLSLPEAQGQARMSITAGIGTPTLDGIVEPGEWTSDTITTTRGVMVSAMMDEENFYVLATWPDATMSVRMNHWTWDGAQWTASEDEDRIAFIWEMSDDLGNPLNGADGPSCATMCHPGEGMSPAFGRVDVWHGKATRFLPIGHTDDKYWDTDGPDGRHSDSGSGSGDRNRNQAQTGPEFRGATGTGVNVTFLVEDQETLNAFNDFGAQLGTADVITPLSEQDQFNEGDTIPGRILSNPTGNRASVRSVGRWSDGMWTVEFSRKLAGETDAEGRPEDFTVRPGGSVRFTTEIFDNLTEHEEHSFSPAGISGGADFTVYTLNFPDPTTLYFAQIGNGAGFTFDTVLTNPSSTPVTAAMDLFSDAGDPLEIGFAAIGDGVYQLSNGVHPAGALSRVEFEIPPLGAVTVSSDGAGEVVAGAAEVTANYPVGGVVRFNIPGIGIAGVGESEPLSSFIVPVRRTPEGINTGIALHHTRTSGFAPLQGGLSLTLTLRNELGEEVAVRVIDDFPVRGHLAQFIGGAGDVLFPSVDTSDFTGTLVVEVTGGEVAATALELGQSPGEFTTLPVTPLSNN